MIVAENVPADTQNQTPRGRTHAQESIAITQRFFSMATVHGNHCRGLISPHEMTSTSSGSRAPETWRGRRRSTRQPWPTVTVCKTVAFILTVMAKNSPPCHLRRGWLRRLYRSVWPRVLAVRVKSQRLRRSRNRGSLRYGSHFGSTARNTRFTSRA